MTLHGVEAPQYSCCKQRRAVREARAQTTGCIGLANIPEERVLVWLKCLLVLTGTGQMPPLRVHTADPTPSRCKGRQASISD